MRALSGALDARAIETQIREFWSGRRLPPSPDDRPGRGGPPIHLSIGGLPLDSTLSLAALQRGVLADVATRAQLLLERTATGPLLFGSRPSEQVPSSVADLWDGLGLWFGRGAMEPLVRPELHPTVDRMLGRLAETNVLLAKNGPLRWCPRCQQPRDPASILYVDEEGPAYLVRFALRDVEPRVDALVWTDAAWKLLGTTAVLVNPKLPYVLAKFTRRGTEERVLTSRSSLERLRAWLPDCEFEVIEEHPGASWAGTPYVHPLAAEYPPLHSLPTPGGQFHSSAEVGDSGTGIVTLTPAHGASDARIAEGLEIPGWPVLSANGLLEGQSSHKYQGLPVDTAEAFILRDLTDSALIFAQLRVRHGVPRCADCASGLFWRPGRAWRLEPDRIDAETLSLFSRLLPREPLPVASEVVPWPVSDTRATTEGDYPALEECSDCSRLAPSGTGPQCPCGGSRTEVRRPLLPIFAEAIYWWARLNPFPQENGVSLFLPEQRRGPVLLTHLVGQFAAMARPAETHLTLLPTGSVEAEDARPDPGAPIDAVRLALIRMAARPRATSPLASVIAEEIRRLRKFWAVASRLSESVARDGSGQDGQSIARIRDSLPPEDRAFVSRFERLRADVLAGLAAGRLPDALGRISRFAERELRERYLLLARSRLEEPGLTSGKSSAYGVLLYVISGLAELWAPFAPFTMESIHRTFRDDARSLFESPLAPVRQSLVDPASEKLLDLVSPVALAIERTRRRLGVPRAARWEGLVISARDEAAASELRELVPVLSRVLPVAAIEIASPAHPWEGRQIRAEPNLVELQRVYRASAGRVATLLSQMPGKRVKEGLRNQTLNVVLSGNPVQILPSMVELSDSLPPRTLVLSYPKGDLYLQLPQGTDSKVSDRMLGLSPEAFRLVRAVRRRLSRAPPDANVTEAWVEVPPALEEELRAHTVAIAGSLRISRFEAHAAGKRFIPGETTWGRTALGTRWRVWVPGLPRPIGRRKVHASRRLGRRARRALLFEQFEEAGVDFLSDDVRNREAAVRTTLEQLDLALGVPLLGPTKLEAAWEAGYRDLESLSHAPYAALAAIPGFGPYVAREVVRHYGGPVPDRIWVWPPIPAGPVAPADASVIEVIPPEPTPAPIQPERPARAEPPPAVMVQPPPFVPSPPPGPRPAPRVSAAQPPTFVPSPPHPKAVPLLPWRPPVAMDSTGSEASPRPGAALSPGIALLVEDTTDTAWSQFLEAVSVGRRGLCVTREFPDRLRRRIGGRDVTVIWLSNVGRQNSVRPSDLGALGTLFVSALEEGHVSAVLLEGFEYLVTVNTLAPVLKLLRELHSRAQVVGTPVWVPVNPRLLTPSEVDMLKATFHSVTG